MSGIGRTTVMALAMLAGAACGHGDAAVDPRADAPARLSLMATVVGAQGATLRVRVFYLRGASGAASEAVDVARADVPVTGGERALPIPLDLAPCLADRARLVPGPTCEVHAEVALVEGADELDRAEVAPLRVRPGETARPTDPVTLVATGSVEIAPNAAMASMRVGGTTQLSAVVRDGAGVIIPGRAPAWSSADTTIATVQPVSGLVTAVRSGTTAITAASGRRSARLGVTVLARVGSVSVAPNPAAVRVGDSLSLSATARDAGGATLAGRVVQWTVDRPTIARVSATSGLVTGVAPGTATVTASVEGVLATTIVTVTVGGIVVTPGSASVAVGASVPLTAAVIDARGAPVAGVTVGWTSSDASVASVDATTGLVTGQRPGSATITASGGGASTLVRVTVAARTLDVEPGSRTIVAGLTLPLTAVGALGPVTWRSSDERVATVSADGVVTARLPGTATITATSGTQTGATTITIRAAAIEVTPSSLVIDIGQSVALRAAVLDAAGREIGGVPVSWTSDDGAVAVVDAAAGRVTGRAPGRTTITASAGGTSASVVVNVSTPPPPRPPVITVAPASVGIVTGDTVRLSAAVADATGAPLTGVVVTWTSSDPSVASIVGATGLVSGQRAGSATITASGAGVRATAAVTVVSRTLAIAPASPTLVAGRTLSLTATGALGAVTWQSSDAAVATVAANGVVTGLRPGAVTITARSGAQSGTNVVTVVAASVQITPAAPTVLLRGTLALSAAVRDASGADIPQVPVAWTSSNPAIVAVNASTGLVTGVAVGSATVAASAGGATQSVTVTVTSPTAAPPSIALATTTASMSYFIANRQVSGADSIAVRNGGGGTLTGLGVTAMDWQGATGWLDASLGSTTAPTTLRLALNTRALALSPGVYLAYVTIGSPVAANGSVTVRVTYTVTR